MNIKDDRQLNLDLSEPINQAIKGKSSFTTAEQKIFLVSEKQNIFSLEDKRNERIRSERAEYISDILNLVKHFK